MKRKKFLIGGFIVVLAVVFLGYMGVQSTATYYLTVSEVKEQGDSIYGEKVRVNGLVAPGSIDVSPNGLVFKFNIVEGAESLAVVYKGIVPDAFEDGADVVVEGKLNSDGVLQANTLLTKCPSKYEPEE